MKYAVTVVAIVYALLCVYASAAGLRRPERRGTAALMLLGALILIVGTVLELRGWGPAWLVVLIGGLLTCQSALLNGRRTGRDKLQHHAVRFLINIFLILGSALW